MINFCTHFISRATGRELYYILFFILLGMVSSLLLDYLGGYHPCLLCLMQRYVLYILFAITFGMTVLPLSSLYLRIGWLILFIFLGLGLFFSIRLVYLQSLPPMATLSCLPEWSILVNYYPWSDILHALINGSSDCRDVSLTFLTLSLAEWSMLYFMGLFGLSCVVLFYSGCKRYESKL
jgi:disulfide bond formation protein DsbB